MNEGHTTRCAVFAIVFALVRSVVLGRAAATSRCARILQAHPVGTPVAIDAGMDQYTQTITVPMHTLETAPRPLTPAVDAAPREREPEQIRDKYDPSTIACTD